MGMAAREGHQQIDTGDRSGEKEEKKGDKKKENPVFFYVHRFFFDESQKRQFPDFFHLDSKSNGYGVIKVTMQQARKRQNCC